MPPCWDALSGGGGEHGDRGSSGEARGPSQHCVTTAREGLLCRMPQGRALPPVHSTAHTHPAYAALLLPPPCIQGTHLSPPSPGLALLQLRPPFHSPPALASRNPRAQWTEEKVPLPPQVHICAQRQMGPQIPAGKCQHPADTHAGSMPGRIFPSLIGLFSLKEVDFRGQQGRTTLDPTGLLRDGHTGGQVTPTTPTEGGTRPRLPPWGSGTGPRLRRLLRP